MATSTQNPPAVTGVVPYLNVDGAAEASAFYQQAFGAEELQRLPHPDGKRLAHVCLRLNGGTLFLSDTFPEYGVTAQPSPSYTLHLQVDDVDAWWKRAVDAGAVVLDELKLQFWGDRYGRLKDRFGIQWSLASTPRP
jgi:PhnB protein